MRILIVPSWYPTPSKPVNGIFVQQQAEALSKEHDVHVLFLDVLPRGGKQRPRRIVRRDGGFIEETIEVRNLPLLWQFAYLFAMARAFRRLRRTFRPDIIHCHTAVPAAWGATMLRRFIGAPVVFTEHSSEFASWLRRPGLRLMARKAFASANAVIAVSEGQRQRIEKVFGRDSDLFVVPNMVDTGEFAPTELPSTEGGYRLLFVGLMDTNQKGIEYLLDALAIIVSQGKLTRALHVDLVGDGQLRVKYEDQAQQLNLSEVVTFKGLQPHNAVAKMMPDYHALVLPSLHEALPLVIIEALACGRPVISTRCGGPEYMIDESTGRIAEPGQPEPLAEAIVDVVTHLDRYDPQHLTKVAASRYSLKAVTTSLTEIYNLLRAEGT